MTSRELPRFDDSEDEEDFNPAPADLSDDELGRDDEHEHTGKSTGSPRDRDDVLKNGSLGRRRKSQGTSDDFDAEDQPSPHDEADDDENQRDDEGGEDEDEDEEDEDEDDVQQVSYATRSGSTFPRAWRD